jgi:hypothetical protein
MDGDNSRPDLMEKMAKEDGCTPYSKEYWEALKQGTTTQEHAYHETLAEMASMRMKSEDLNERHIAAFGAENAATMADAKWKDEFAPPTAKPPDEEGRRFLTGEFSKDWQNLFNAVSDNWEKKHNK